MITNKQRLCDEWSKEFIQEKELILNDWSDCF